MQLKPPPLKSKAFSTELENKAHSNVRGLTKTAPILRFPKHRAKLTQPITKLERQLHLLSTNRNNSTVYRGAETPCQEEK